MGFRLASFLGLKPREPQWRSGAGDPVLSLTADGAIAAANIGAESLLAAEGGLEARSFADFIAREDRPALKDALCRALQAEKAAPAERFCARLLRPGKPPLFAEISLARRGKGLSALPLHQRKTSAPKLGKTQRP